MVIRMQIDLEYIAKNQKDVIQLLLHKLPLVDIYHLSLVSRSLKNTIYQKTFADMAFLSALFPRIDVDMRFDKVLGAKNIHIMLKTAIELQ